MKNYKFYLSGLAVLLAGIAIGWIVKPSNVMSGDMDHSSHIMENDVSGETSGKEQIWTCSMHPQIRQNEFGLCPICEMDLIPLDNSLANDDPTILQMTHAAAKLAQVEVTKVGGDMSAMKSSSLIKVDGTVELDARSINAQSSHIGGRIEALFVNFEGEYVKAGQKIATIYSTELLAASQELITAAKFENKVSGITDASIQKLKNWKISDQQIQQILSSLKPIETVDIYADHSGYVLDKKTALGDYVRQGQALYTLGQTSRLWLIFNVFESDLGQVRVGQNVVFTSPSLGSQELNARISYIDPLLNPSSRTAVVRAEFANRGGKLKPGMLLKGIIAGHTLSSGTSKILVPRTAVLWTGEKSVVYVQVPDIEIPSYQFREVIIGNQSGEMIEIIEGIEAGELIVTKGAFAIDAAAQLNNNFSMMNKDVTIKSDGQGDQVPDYTLVTPEEFKDQLDVLVQSYISLKDALVETNAVSGKEKAKSILDELQNVDMSLVKDDAHLYWMKQLSAIKAHATNIKESDDVEEQRNQFDFLSQGIINSLKAFGTNESTYYVLYCPMVKNNQGADWVSTDAQIRNPYFGEKMMKCGSVKLELNKDYTTGSRPRPDTNPGGGHNH